jgi:hypothetical protein
MRPGILKRALVVAGLGVLTVTASACESTQQESAKIGREAGAQAAGPAALKLGAVNHGVRVADATLLHGEGRLAVAVKLTATTQRAQLNVPVLVNVTGAGGKLLYTNGTGGAEASLQRIALLRPRTAEWWVNDQVLASSSASGVKVRVGTGTRAPRGAQPELSTTATHLGEQSGLSVLSGRLVNRSHTAQSKVPVFAVALRDGKPVAAGRAVISELAGRPGASAPFQVFLVGKAAGATVQVTAVPTSAKKGK